MEMTGNRCGHNPASPLLDLSATVPTGKGGMPLVITRAMEYLERYYSSPSLFPSLDAANASDRQQRSERREACIRLLKGLLRYLDIASLRVGFASADGFQPITLDLLVRDTGLPKRRLERAHRDLKAAGLLSCSQPRQRRPDGQIVGLAGIRAISKHLWGRLGLATLLERQRKRHSQQLKKKRMEKERARRETPAEKANAGLMQRAIANTLGGSSRRKPKPETAGPPGATDQDRKDQMMIALDLRREHPDWTAKEINERAWQILLG